MDPAMMQQMAQMVNQDPAMIQQMIAAMHAKPGATEGIAPSASAKAPPAASALRANANELFKSGDLPGAVAAYEEELTHPTELRLPLLSNLGLCHNLKLGAPELATIR